MLIDVETINAVLKLLEQMILEYAPDSPESIALFMFKERVIAKF